MGESLTRRNFLKGAGAVAAGTAAAFTLSSCAQNTENANLEVNEELANTELVEE